MKIDGGILLVLIVIFMFSRVVMKWKQKADLWDLKVGNKKDENYVPNYQELMQTKEFIKFKARLDYFFISLSLFVNWMLQRVRQIKWLIVEEKK